MMYYRHPYGKKHRLNIRFTYYNVLAKIKDPLSWVSTKHPMAHMVPSFERSEIACDNGNTWGQNCSALRKNWLALKIARREHDDAILMHSMRTINEIQESMGIQRTFFSELQGYAEDDTVHEVYET